MIVRVRVVYKNTVVGDWRFDISMLNNTISFSESPNFLRRMLHENEGSGKDQFLGDPDWLSEM